MIIAIITFRKCDHKKIIFPGSLINKICKVAKEWHVVNLHLILNNLTRIGLISDTHHYLDKNVFEHFKNCDEIWHAGDFGGSVLADELLSFKPLKGVYGNIDGYDIRSVYPEILEWKCEDVKVMMAHIGGYPPRYTPAIKKEIVLRRPQLFISGHSHILKVMYDQQLNCLHMNPGAAGNHGWHKLRTLIRFTIDGKDIKDCEVIELGGRKAV